MEVRDKDANFFGHNINLFLTTNAPTTIFTLPAPPYCFFCNFWSIRFYMVKVFILEYYLIKRIVSLCNVNVVSICNIIMDVTFIRCPWLSVPSLPSQQIPRSHIISTVITTIIIIIILWSSIKSYHLVQLSNCFCLVSERAVPVVSLLHQLHPGFGLITICLNKMLIIC